MMFESVQSLINQWELELHQDQHKNLMVGKFYQLLLLNSFQVAKDQHNNQIGISNSFLLKQLHKVIKGLYY